MQLIFIYENGFLIYMMSVLKFFNWNSTLGFWKIRLKEKQLKTTSRTRTFKNYCFLCYFSAAFRDKVGFKVSLQSETVKYSETMAQVMLPLNITSNSLQIDCQQIQEKNSLNNNTRPQGFNSHSSCLYIILNLMN